MMVPVFGTVLGKKVSPICLACILVLLPYTDSFAQDEQYRPQLFLQEGWEETPPATPITQEHVANSNLVLGLYGPGSDQIRKSNHEIPVDDPFYVWSGRCNGNWAVTLQNSNSYVDLSQYAKVLWRSRQSGLRCLHLIVKLADGTWMVSDQCDDQSEDWRIHQFNIADINWYALDIETVVEGRLITDPDLSMVDEVGFTDLMTGGGTPASSRLDWIEVYGNAVDR